MRNEREGLCGRTAVTEGHFVLPLALRKPLDDSPSPESAKEDACGTAEVVSAQIPTPLGPSYPCFLAQSSSACPSLMCEIFALRATSRNRASTALRCSPLT